MNLPEIAIVNFSSLSDREVQHAIRAVNRQVVEDFAPIWGSGYVSQLHASIYGYGIDAELALDPVRAAGVIYIVDEAHLPGALGYHDMNASEVPYGFVFTDLGDWTITFSHEVLEMIIDPTVNILVPGPDPRFPHEPDRWLFHTYEVCDAVERTSYFIDDVEVSNFVTPQYFRVGDAAGTRNDFLGVDVPSFGVTNGSHLGVLDPANWAWQTIWGNQIMLDGSLSERLANFCSRNERSRVDEGKKVAVQLMDVFYGCIEKAKNPGTRRMSGLSRGQRYQVAGEAIAKTLRSS